MCFLIVVYFGARETSYGCRGTLVNQGVTQADTAVYFDLVEYRWFVKMWAEPAGDLRLEIPLRDVRTFTVRKISQKQF